MLSAVCLGETMAMLTPTVSVPLNEARHFLCGVGGAESNVAMGLADMGVNAHWISRVGQDGFGRRILTELMEQGVGLTGVAVDGERPTGLYFKVPEGADDVGNSVLYYRQGSAASAMDVDTLTDPAVASLMDDASLIHLSGITAALSPGCLQLMHKILAAPRGGRMVSFDVNWRPNLWAGQDPGVLLDLANLADVVLVGRDEAEHAFGTGDEAALRRLLPDPEVVVIKNAGISAIALGRNGSRVEIPALNVEVLEPVGAGDAFAAGYLSGMLFGFDQKVCLRRGHISAACTLTVPVDRGQLPPHDVLARLITCSDEDWAGMTISGGDATDPGFRTEAK